MLKKISLSTAIFCAFVSVAHAGDPIDLKRQIITEPENNDEYARSCEIAGPGFKYIPGTQTCIRISGHVSYEINVKSK